MSTWVANLDTFTRGCIGGNMALRMHFCVGHGSDRFREPIVLTTEPAVMGAAVRLGSNPRGLRGEVAVRVPSKFFSADQLLIFWDPEESQVILRNLSSKNRVRVHRWGCLPKTLDPGAPMSSDCRVVIEFREYWFYVSPDPQDGWRFDFDPEVYLEKNPDARVSRALKRTVTPLEWVEVYSGLRERIKDVHREYLAAWRQGELSWPPKVVPDRVEEMALQDAAALIPISAGQFGRRINEIPNIAERYLNAERDYYRGGHQDQLLDFLVDNKLLTFKGVYPYLHRWGQV